MEESEKLQKAVSMALTAGFHLDEDAFSLLNLISKTEDPQKLMEATLEKLKISSERSLLIRRDFLEATAKETFNDTISLPTTGELLEAIIEAQEKGLEFKVKNKKRKLVEKKTVGKDPLFELVELDE